MRDSVPTALVVGGGVAGMEAALKIGQAGYKVVLVEQEPALGGVMGQLYSSFPRWENPRELLDYKIGQLGQCAGISVLTGTAVVNARRKNAALVVELQSTGAGGVAGAGECRQEVFDAVVLATGFEMFDASIYGEYGYGIYPGVMNSLEFESRLRELGSSKGGEQPRDIAFIKCVGSRDRSKGFPYCSKICCMYTAKQAGMVRELLPDARAYVFYMDYRAAGKEYEEFVRSVIETRHVRYVRGRPSKVLPENGRLTIRAEDTLMGVPIEVEVDLVVLAAAIVPRPQTRRLAECLGANLDRYGFIESEPHNPARAAARVFFAGACGFAVESQGAQYQGAAAAAEVIALFSQGGE